MVIDSNRYDSLIFFVELIKKLHSPLNGFLLVRFPVDNLPKSIQNSIGLLKLLRIPGVNLYVVNNRGT